MNRDEITQLSKCVASGEVMRLCETTCCGVELRLTVESAKDMIWLKGRKAPGVKAQGLVFLRLLRKVWTMTSQPTGFVESMGSFP